MIRQLHYTSTETGPDGVQGFQVTASTPGIQERHEDLAIRLSAYRPSPDFPLTPSDDDVRRSPVRFGYLPTDDAVFLFQSAYTGADFTGRQGNYFAHALVLDGNEPFGDTLPVDLWASPLWARRSPSTRTLPAVTRLPAGPIAGPAAIREFLLGAGRLDRFATLLGAVQRTLARQRGRVVLVCSNTDHAAHWIAAVLSSLPRQAALGLSFTTFSPSPTEDEFTLVATTPDVRVTPRPYDPHVTVDLAGGSGDDLGPDSGRPGGTTPTPTPYAAAYARAWQSSARDAAGLTSFLTGQWPELGFDQLDDAGAAWSLALGRPLAGASLPATATFAIRRFPAQAAAVMWEHLGQALRAGSAVEDPAAWAPLLAQARSADVAVPPEVEAGYVSAALSHLARSRAASPAAGGDRGELWLPDLRQPHLDDAVSTWLRGATSEVGASATPPEASALPAPDRLAAAGVAVSVSVSCSRGEQGRIAAGIGPILLDAAPAALWNSLRGLPPGSAVLTGVAALLETRLRSADGLSAVVAVLPSIALRVLGPATAKGSLLEIALLLAAARLGETDEVEALRTITRRGRRPAPARSVVRLAQIIWADRLPTAAQACALLALIQEVCTGSVAGTSLPDLLIEIMIADAQSRDGLTDDDGRLASQLYLDTELVGTMSRGAAQIAQAVYLGWYFRETAVPGREAAQAAGRAVRMYVQLEKSIGGWLLDGVAGWLVQSRDVRFHLAQLEALEAAGGEPFRAAYSRRAARRVRAASPEDLALLVPVWFANARTGAIGLHLMEQVVPTELAHRRRRDLGEVTTAMRVSARELAVLSDALDPAWNNDWGQWWEHWRAGHSKSLFGRLRRPSGRR